VRQQKRYKGEQEFDRERKWKLKSQLDEFFKIYSDHRLGAATFSNGKPDIGFKWDDKYETEGEAERKDQFTTRITATVVDVKPNGNLVLEATAEEVHGDDRFTVTLTGVCRSEDVTLDNTILSSQIAELVLIEKNHGEPATVKPDHVSANIALSFSTFFVKLIKGSIKYP